MSLHRVRRPWRQGERLGRQLRRPLLLAECVPGGTTTAQAVLTGLGLSVKGLVSGSARQIPCVLKAELVDAGLRQLDQAECLHPERVIAAVGDPFQAVAAGLLVGASTANQPVLLGGGSQMLAVLALALKTLPQPERERMAQQVLIGTTAWLAEETGETQPFSMLSRLVDAVADGCDVPLAVVASGLRFNHSRHQQLRDYEAGYVKEGVGAGALLLLAQLRGLTPEDLLQRCDSAMDALLSESVEPVS